MLSGWVGFGPNIYYLELNFPSENVYQVVHASLGYVCQVCVTLFSAVGTVVRCGDADKKICYVTVIILETSLNPPRLSQYET